MELWVKMPAESKRVWRVSLLVGQTLSVGRGPGVDVSVPSLSVARRHCELRLDETGVWVTDADTLPGTRLNGSQIRGESQVGPCDLIVIGGEVEIRVVPSVAVDPTGFVGTMAP